VISRKVWVYPERTWEALGAVRYQVSWEEVKKSAQGKDDIDPDLDIAYLVANFKTKAAAMKYARKLVDGYRTAFGAATVTKQVVDWYVQEDGIAEWINNSEATEVS
jgi:hypothetical protein